MKAKIPSNMFFTDLAACCVTLGIKYSHSTLLFLRFYLFIFRERGKEEKKRERNIDRLPLTGSKWGPSLQPRHVP